MASSRRIELLACGVLLYVLIFVTPLHAGNDVLGEIQLVGATKVEKTSGVWIDGQYVGYLKELKGSKKILLLPGEHEIVVRQAGYQDFAQRSPFNPEENRSSETRTIDEEFVLYVIRIEVKHSIQTVIAGNPKTGRRMTFLIAFVFILIIFTAGLLRDHRTPWTPSNEPTLHPSTFVPR